MKWFQGWLHNWIQVSVPLSEVHVPLRRRLVYSHQCGRCGLLRHKVSPPRVASIAITYQPTDQHGPVKKWYWYYPDDWRRCGKLKEVLG